MDELDDHAAQLYARIGMLMEDTHLEVLTISEMTIAERVAAIERVGTAIDQMKALLAEARALLA